MSSITHHGNGTITFRMDDEAEFVGGTPLTREQMIEHLKALGYIIIDPNHAQYCHYVSGECPHCGRPAERPSP